jgi:hypothetical protein
LFETDRGGFTLARASTGQTASENINTLVLDSSIASADAAPNTPRYSVTAQSSWDFRLGIGLGYRF